MTLSLTRPIADDPMLLSNGKAQTVILDELMDAIEAVDAIVRAPERGIATLAADVSTLSLVAAFNQADTLYQVILEVSWQTTWVASAKTTTGLTITFGVPVPTGGGTVYWRVEP